MAGSKCMAAASSTVMTLLMTAKTDAGITWQLGKACCSHASAISQCRIVSVPGTADDIQLDNALSQTHKALVFMGRVDYCLEHYVPSSASRAPMMQASEAESRANSAEAQLEQLQEAAASSGSTIEQWQAAYADLQQQQEAAVAELQQAQQASSSNDSSLEEWRNAYADLQQQCSSLQVTHSPFASADEAIGDSLNVLLPTA